VALLGDECVLIKAIKEISSNQKGRKRKESQSDTQLKSNNKDVIDHATCFDIKIAGSCNNKMIELRNTLNGANVVTNTTVWQKASLPIFKYKNKWLRAMIALTLGCDVYQGVKGMGITIAFKTIEDLMNQHDNDEIEVTAGYMKILMKKSKLDEPTLHTLLMAFLFEPGISMSNLNRGEVKVNESS
jgi:hypothetical protein